MGRRLTSHKERPMTSDNGSKPAAIYARISADPQGRAVGVTDQAAQGRTFAADHGWDITGPGCGCKDCKKFRIPADVYCDNDTTASGKKRRPHYERLLADIGAGRVGAVITTDADRLHRHPMELEQYINICQPRDVPTHTIKKGDIDLTNSTGRMVARMLGAAARHEWERMVERQLNAKRRNRDAGMRTGGSRPFGYQLDHESSLVIDEREAQAVREGYRLLLAGAGCYTIAAAWNKAGYRTPLAGDRGGGNAWQQVTVRQLLNRAVNASLIEHGGEIVGKGRWEPIVDENTWRATRAILTSPSRRSTPGPKPRHLLTGVLICGVCGNTRFAAHPGGTAGAIMYVCAVDRPGLARKSCVARDVAKLDAYVEAIIIERLSRPDVITAFAKPGEDVAALDARRTALNARLRDWAGQPGITPQQVAIASAPLIEELGEVEGRITAALRAPELGEFTRGADPAAVWGALTIERKRAIAKMLLRVRLLPQAHLKMPAGWRIGMPRPLREEAIEILSPDE
jgi:DNA invertase Pin-like site-specific DNA recombinase